MNLTTMLLDTNRTLSRHNQTISTTKSFLFNAVLFNCVYKIDALTSILKLATIKLNTKLNSGKKKLEVIPFDDWNTEKNERIKNKIKYFRVCRKSRWITWSNIVDVSNWNSFSTLETLYIVCYMALSIWVCAWAGIQSLSKKFQLNAWKTFRAHCSIELLNERLNQKKNARVYENGKNTWLCFV